MYSEILFQVAVATCAVPYTLNGDHSTILFHSLTSDQPGELVHNAHLLPYLEAVDLLRYLDVCLIPSSSMQDFRKFAYAHQFMAYCEAVQIQSY